MDSIKEIELKLLLEAIYQHHGYDFRNYAESSLRRRFELMKTKYRCSSFSQLQHLVLHEPLFFKTMLYDLTVTTSEMFRDPSFFMSLRERVFPMLRTYPTLNVWHAGCSTGEEVYSLAILLHEEDLLSRSTIYATDINQLALKQAREGIYPINSMKQFTLNYQRSGGTRSFAEYYTAGYGAAQINKDLQKNIVFSDHNLITDSVFCESHLILCRNVLIYFNRLAKGRVITLFADSLRHGGFLCLGSKEALQFLESASQFETFFEEEKVFRKSNQGKKLTSLLGVR